MQIPAWVRVNDVFIACLEFVCLDDISRCMRVSKMWHQPITSSVVLWNNTFQRVISGVFLSPLPGTHRLIARDAHSLQLRHNVLARAVATTSTDHASQGLRNTLANNPVKFWSSGANVNEDDCQSVIYEVSGQHGAIVKSVGIRFYQEFRQTGLPRYTSKTVRVQCGYGRLELSGEDNDEDLRVSEVTPGITWVCISDWFFCEHTIEMQTFTLPHATPAQYLQIDFKGPRTRQTDADNLFYVCLNRVHAYGTEIEQLPPTLFECLARKLPMLVRPFPLPASDYGADEFEENEVLEYERKAKRLNDGLTHPAAATPANQVVLRAIWQDISAQIFSFEMAHEAQML